MPRAALPTPAPAPPPAGGYRPSPLAITSSPGVHRDLSANFAETLPPRLPTPSVSRHAYQLQNGKWELGSEFQSIMVKSAPTMLERLQKAADYQKLKEWTSMVEDWVEGYTQVSPKSLGPNAVRLLARMTMSSGLYS